MIRALLFGLLLACSSSPAPEQKPQPVAQPQALAQAQPAAASVLTLGSSDFAPKQGIPIVHTCEGQDRSPELHWSGIPSGTKSLALIVDDPDAPDPAKPQRTWVHWVVYDIPPNSSGIAQGASPAKSRAGHNDWRREGYGGPCPPIGRHRYFFKLFALDTELGDLHNPTSKKLQKAMDGHILGMAQLVGTYQKQQP